MAAFNDLRGFLEHVQALGELKSIRGAHWDVEIGGIAEVAQHRRNGPAVMFDEIVDYPAGYRVLVNGMGSSGRTALVLGLPTHLSYRELLPLWKERSRDLQLLPPRVVADGPLMQNVRTGPDVDLFSFPAPRWHEEDGGRYLGTGNFVATRDPDSGWVNLGCYRVMLKSENEVFFFMSPGKHGGLMREKYLSRGERMPIAMSFGHDPTLFLAASVEVPPQTSEYDYAGGMKGEPVEVIQGPVTGLPIPAHAEIVLEGFIEPGNFAQEGPFGEWTGYYASGHHAEPIVDVHAVYYRDHPIILGAPPGKPPTELTSYRSLMRSALLWEQVERMGVPDVTGVWCHEAGGTRLFLVVSVKQRYPGHARQVGHAVASTRSGNYANRYVIVVDDDVDVTDIDDVLWALCMHSDPAESIDLIRATSSGPLDPRISPDKRARGDYSTSKVVIDATRPYHWRDQFPHPVGMSPALRQQIEREWGEFLLSPGNGERASGRVGERESLPQSPTPHSERRPLARSPRRPLT